MGALLLSRAVVWAAGVGAVLAWGVHDHNAAAFDPEGRARPFGAVGDALVAPASYWDTVWFLRIAEDGYTAAEAAFFPLYPLVVAAAGALTGSPLVGAIAVSLACLAGALVLVHRLVALDFGERIARTTVLLVACFPFAVFLSAAYSEALFLLLSVGAVYAARTGRWAWAGAAAGLAAGTRSAGLVLLVPLAVLWWEGRSAGRARRADLGWLALAPLGLAGFCAGLAAGGVDPLAPFSAQEAWSRGAAVPVAGGIAEGVAAGVGGLADVVTGEPRTWPVYDPAWMDLGLLACLVGALAALAGAARRLPRAYWLYAAAALALPLSFPADGSPLMSLPRFLAVLWPLHLWLAVVLCARGPRAVRAAVAVSLAGLAVVSAEVATWGWVA